MQIHRGQGGHSQNVSCLCSPILYICSGLNRCAMARRIILMLMISFSARLDLTTLAFDAKSKALFDIMKW